MSDISKEIENAKKIIAEQKSVSERPRNQQPKQKENCETVRTTFWEVLW